MEMEHMTAAEFADAIGVQRSSVSHVINGRNNPSSTFLQKILSRFPNIDSRWLMLGEGSEPTPSNNSLFETNSTPPLAKTEEQEKTITPTTQVKDPIADSLFQMEREPSTHNSESHIRTETNQRRISRIVIFYDDKTFTEYYPGE